VTEKRVKVESAFPFDYANSLQLSGETKWLVSAKNHKNLVRRENSRMHQHRTGKFPQKWRKSERKSRGTNKGNGSMSNVCQVDGNL